MRSDQSFLSVKRLFFTDKRAGELSDVPTVAPEHLPSTPKILSYRARLVPSDVMTLSQRFFLIAFLVVLGIVAAFGGWAGQYVANSIAKGVGATAAGSIISLLSQRLDNALASSGIGPEHQAEIDAAFDIASTSTDTRLLMMRLRRPDGELVIEAGNELGDKTDGTVDLRAARDGQLNVRFVDVEVPAIGDLPASLLPVVKIFAPLRNHDGDVAGIAELYFGAEAIRRLQDSARTDTWLAASLVGFAALGLVALLVEVTGRVISQQRQRLAANLRQTRTLLKENIALQKVSNALRMESTLANERVLAEVGSDIHDGPLQLLTLLILRLPGADGKAISNRELAQRALEELRAISSGLVLPELAEMTLAEAINAAITRHKDLTGAAVTASIDLPPEVAAPMTVRICAYRVVQEALNNANRHGDGDGARVVAAMVDGELSLEITNRVVSEQKVQPKRAQLGLRGMRLRVESQGGRLSVDVEDGCARVSARIPLADLPGAALPDPADANAN
jgi:signal transduction histidine kinase